jgi:C4-dicarboxylate transporter, DctQ subunit
VTDAAGAGPATSRLDGALTKVENFLAAGSLGAATLIAVVAVVLRTFFNEIIFWSEEAIIYLVIFSTFLGAVITLRHNEHVNVDLVAVFLGERGKKVMAVIGTLVLIAYLAVVGWFAWLLIFEPQTQNTVTPAMGLPLWVVTLPLPIGLTLMLLRAVEILVRALRGLDPYPHAEATLLEAEGGESLRLEEDRDEGQDGGPRP